MLKKITTWVHPPFFPDDEDKTHIAGMLHLILLVFLISVSVALLLLVTGSLPITNNVFINSAMMITFVVVITLLFILHKGYFRVAAWAFLFFQWATTVVQVIWSGGIESPAIIAFIITLLLASFLISQRAVFLFAGLSVLSVLAVWQLGSASHLPRQIVFVSPQGKIFIILTIMAGSAALLTLITRALNQALLRSRAYIKELEQAIQEKTQAEIILHESVVRYRGLLENIPAITYIVELEQKSLNATIYVSPQIEKVAGYASAEFLNDPLLWVKLIHPDDQTRVMAESNRADQTNGPFVSDYRIITYENKTLWFHDESVLVKDEHGEPLYRLGIWADITERKQAETERESFIKELEMRNAEMERFTYTVSHDLKSPLVTIKGFLGMLKKDMEDNRRDRIQKDFERITEATEKMGTLLSELLELSRIGRVVNPPMKIDPVILAYESLEMLDGRIQSENIKVHVSPDLPAVYGDHVRLREVFENLIDNAVKYTGGQPYPLIEIGNRNTENEVIFFVKDNGMGIDPKYHARIFGLFEKLDPTTEGTGVGLALIKRIIEVHGGRIWVESEGLGKGSTFCFTVPNNISKDKS